MYYIEYLWVRNLRINCNYNSEKKYLEALQYFRKLGRKVLSHGIR